MAQSMAERTALDALEPIWSRQGYTLVRAPAREQVPEFLGGYQPDAIATGKQPGLIIEVVGAQANSAKQRVSQLRRLFDGHPDWKLEVVYSPVDAAEVDAVPPATIEDSLEAAEQIAATEPRAALMLAWAAMEAAGRSLHPGLAGRDLSATALVGLLIAQGDVDQESHGELTRLGRLRNRIAHGQLNLEPTDDDVRGLVALTRNLLGELPRSAAR
jgi:hypothetical protein